MDRNSFSESQVLQPFNNKNNLQSYCEKSDRFQREDERLKTFEKWPLEWLDKHVLAMTGMFYTGIDDKTRCYFCNIIIGQWENEDEPVQEHLRWSSNCDLLRGRKTDNIPINAEILANILPIISYDVVPSTPTLLRSPKNLPQKSENSSQKESESNENKLCKICFANECNTAFLSCGHVVSCVKCASSVRHCPVCRAPSAGIVRLYFS